MKTKLLEQFAGALPEPTLLVTSDGTVCGANPAAVRMFNLPRPLPDGYSLSWLVTQSLADIDAYLSRCARSRQPIPGRLQLKAGSGAALRIDGSVVSPAAADQAAIIMLRARVPSRKSSEFHILQHHIELLNKEIAARQRAQVDLFTHREWLRVTLESIGDGVIASDRQGGVVFINPVAEQLTGWPERDAIGQPLDRVFRIVRQETGEEIENPYQEVVRTNRWTSHVNHSALVDRSGRRRPIANSAAPIRDEAGRFFGVVLVFQDVTEQRRAERELNALNETLEQRVWERTAELNERTVQLRALTAQLTHAEQTERRRLAELLHDHLQQFLVAARLRLHKLRKEAEDPLLRENASNIEELIHEAIAASRALTVELSPPVLYQGNLADALQWLAGWFSKQHGLQVHLHSNVTRDEVKGDGLSDTARVLLFQATRELLLNIVKHAGVDQAVVRLEQHSANIVLEVIDQGVGFASEAAFQGHLERFGLFSIRERMEAYGAKLELDSAPGRGTRIRLSGLLQSSVAATTKRATSVARPKMRPSGGQ